MVATLEQSAIAHYKYNKDRQTNIDWNRIRESYSKTKMQRDCPIFASSEYTAVEEQEAIDVFIMGSLISK